MPRFLAGEKLPEDNSIPAKHSAWIKICLASWEFVTSSTLVAFARAAIVAMLASPDQIQQVDDGLTSSNRSSHHMLVTAALLVLSTPAFQPGFCLRAT